MPASIRPHRLFTCAALIAAFALLTVPRPSAGAPARAARTISLNDSAHMYRTSVHGFRLNEYGRAGGTVSGPLYLHLTIASTTRVTAEFNIYSGGGSITGYASASYHSSGSSASFSGTMWIGRGTGGYSRARGSGLRFSGTIERSNDAVFVRVSGNIYD